MREQVSAIAALGPPGAARLMTGGDIAFSQTQHQVSAKLVAGNDIALAGWEQEDAFALTVYLNQDRIADALDADITARAQDADAMDPPTKARALAAVATEQLALDRKIVELVFRAHAEGLSGIKLRADTPP